MSFRPPPMSELWFGYYYIPLPERPNMENGS